MKCYEIYRNIRKKALIYGLSVPLFALMMMFIIGSMLVIIFSFSFAMIITAVVFNLVAYIFLSRLTENSQLLNFRKVFPALISNKKISGLDYED